MVITKLYALLVLINQVVIIPCGISANLSDGQRKEIYDSCQKCVDTLKAGGIRAECDDRDNYTAGWKFNHYEVKVSVINEMLLVIICSNVCKVCYLSEFVHTLVTYCICFFQLGCTT